MSTETVTIGNQTLRAEVSALGAEMQSLDWRGHPLLWNGDAAFWTGRSPILFPIVGRADSDRIAVNGRVAEMKQHGFARRSLFALIRAEAGSCTHELTASEATREAYPFAFRLSLTHAIVEDTLTVTARVTNKDTEPMPFGLGFHPAFLWPLPGSGNAQHKIALDNGAEPALARLEGGLLPPTRLPSPFRAGRLPLAHDQFEDDAMIFPEGAGEGLAYGADSGVQLRFHFRNLPNLALWQKPGAPFLCIEPWHGMAQGAGSGPEIADRPFSQILAPGMAAEFAFSVTVTGSALA